MRKLAWILVAVLAVPAHAQERAVAVQDLELWDLTAPRVSIRFNIPLLRDVGVTLSGGSSQPFRDGYVTYALGGDGRLVAIAPGSIFRTVGMGELRFTSGPGLAWAGGQSTLQGARLLPGAEPATFTISAADGTPLFFADHQHHDVNRQARTLRLYNLDVRLSADLAGRLGTPEHAGLAVGVMEIEAGAMIPRGSVERPLGDCVNPDWGAPDNDVALINLSTISAVQRYNLGDPQLNRVAIAPSAVLKNVGRTDVPWHRKFATPAPPYNNDQHPFLIWNLFRIADGRIQQVGASGTKHAFVTVNSNCACAGGNVLWVNCEDTYSVGNNNSSTDLGPRSEINAYRGTWKRCGSIYDPNCDNVQDGVPPFTGPTDKRRMNVFESDLLTPGAQYLFEGWYLVRDDVNIFNTMGYRQIAPSFNGTTWSFGLLTQLIPGPAIDAWVNPANPGPNADTRRVKGTEDGRLTLAVRATDLGGGQWRYDYALMNHDFNQRVRTFEVPIPAGAQLSNWTFADSDHDEATDWVATISGDSIVWTAPLSKRAVAPLDWGMLNSFSFEANVPPTQAQGVTARLGIMNSLRSLFVPILGPGPAAP